MELVVTEVAIYTPPILVAALFYIYRNSLFAFSNWDRILPVVSNQLMHRANQFIEILRAGSQYIFQVKNALQVVTSNILAGPLLLITKAQELLGMIRFQVQTLVVYISMLGTRLFDSLRAVGSAVQVVADKILAAPLSLYRFIQEVLATLRFQFQIVRIQVSNFTETLYGTLNPYLFPPEKTRTQLYWQIGLFALSIAVIVFSWWYLQTVKQELPGNQNEVPAIKPAEAPIVEKKKPVRRKQRKA